MCVCGSLVVVVTNGPPPSFGEIHSIRVLSERRCAFINYTRKKAAEAAYTAMKVGIGWGALFQGVPRSLKGAGDGAGSLRAVPVLGLAPSCIHPCPCVDSDSSSHLVLCQEAELEGSRLVLQLKHPSHATPSPWQHPGRPQ